jgi:hypothetical protein
MALLRAQPTYAPPVVCSSSRRSRHSRAQGRRDRSSFAAVPQLSDQRVHQLVVAVCQHRGFSMPGDVVEVRNTGFKTLQLSQNGDGSVPWDQWLHGSKLS